MPTSFEQVQAAVAALANSGQTLQTRLGTLDAWIGEAPAFEMAEGQALLTDVDLGTELGLCQPALDTLQNALGGLSATIQTLQQSGDGWTDQWTADHAAMDDACGAFDAACTASVQTVSQELQALSAAAQGLTQKFVDAEGATQQAFLTMTTALAEPWSEALANQFNALAAELGQQHVAQLSSSFNATRQGFEKIRDALESSLGEQSGQFQAALQEELQGIGAHLNAEMQARLQGAIQGLMDDAVQRIARDIAESILQSGIGVQTSATLAPLVPQLIAIKHVANALIEAIRFFRNPVSIF